MQSPFASVGTLILGASIFGVAVVCAIVFFSPVPQTSPTANTAASTSTIKTAATVSTTAVGKKVTSTVASTSATTTKTATQPLSAATSSTASLTIFPSQIIEGDPVFITLKNGTTADIKSSMLTAQGPNSVGGNATIPLHFIDYKNTPVAFYGTGINQATGKAIVTVTLDSGAKISASFVIGKRVSPVENLAVPASLGGNSTSSQENLVANLTAENAELADIYSNPDTSFWAAPFTWPIHTADITGGIVVTDPFGYERNSGAENIIHKGTDFKAPPGTPVYAINAGFVRVTKLFTVYGNTVIVDHGMGIQSFYMHLSQMVVTPGEAVTQGQLLGYSGETGYSEGPHLHLTVRIGGVSIDPMKFFAFFGLTPDGYAN